jgi:hypothetical protein
MVEADCALARQGMPKSYRRSPRVSPTNVSRFRAFIPREYEYSCKSHLRRLDGPTRDMLDFDERKLYREVARHSPQARNPKS